LTTKSVGAQLPDQSKTSPKIAFNSSLTTLLQRKCACGNHTSGGECAESKKRGSLQRSAVSNQLTNEVPIIVHDVLRSPGHPLDAATRAFFEPRFGHDFSQVRVHTAGPKRAQTRLNISQPGDPYEREADRVADQVMRIPEPAATEEAAVLGQTQVPQIQHLCSECEEKLHRQPMKEEEEEEEGSSQPVDMDMPEPDELMESPQPLVAGRNPEAWLQRMCTECEEKKDIQAKEISGQTAAVSSSVEPVQGGGKPLDTSVRSFFEPRFGYIFDRVRVHTDARAAESARAVNALAYTLGHHIVFGTGQYAPDTTAGRRLMAHELTHVVQQNPSHAPVKSPGLSNGPVRVQAAPNGSTILQRWSIGDPVAGINTIVCNGSGGITTQLGATGNADQTRCLKDCIESHEQSHRADALAEKANICSGVAAGKTVRPDAGAQQKATEIKASNAEINCLTPQLPKVGEVCKNIMQARIKQMEAYRDSFK
jgi:hypothetical protein